MMDEWDDNGQVLRWLVPKDCVRSNSTAIDTDAKYGVIPKVRYHFNERCVKQEVTLYIIFSTYGLFVTG